ncbi:MAG TPA: peptidoglycan-binding protein [Myxococcota bacterium]|nr:peptidoglycan-binding protein [Myxococcota bacterium]
MSALKRTQRAGAPSEPVATEAAPAADAGRANSAPRPMAEAKQGPFDGWLTDALAACFGDDLQGVDAELGDKERTAALGAEAMTEGTQMTFGADVGTDPQDKASMEVIGHEVSHALAGGGSGATALDQQGDPGEHTADDAGKRFSAWVSGGMKGPAPRLRAATGGQAEVHRKANVPTGFTGSPPLRVGSRGGQVSALQSLLNAHGANLSVDGDFGPRTHAAVVSFQQSHGLAPDGVAGPATAAALNGSARGSANNNAGDSGRDTPAPAPAAPAVTISGDPALREGSRGGQVTALQRRLNELGGSLVVDGDFGGRTAAAVRAFQQANRLTADGVVGPRTAAVLNSGGAKAIGSNDDHHEQKPNPDQGQLEPGMLSEHFSLAEFACHDGSRTPSDVAGNLRELAQNLEVLRSELRGAAIHVNSGYRSPAYNRSIGGATDSQHMYGRAADITIGGYSPSQVHATIERLIRAGRMKQGGLGLYSSFVHYDTRGTAARW